MTEPAGPLRVAVIGSHARSCLAALRHGPGSVIAVFERSFYVLADATGDLACLGTMGIGGGPLNAQISNWRAVRTRVGARAAPTESGFALPGGIEVEGDRAQAHRSPAGPFFAAAGALPLLAETAKKYSRIDGFAPLVVRHTGANSALVERAFGGIEQLKAWCRLEGPNLSPPAEAIRRLLGLGPGLTPSGDDFLGGMMIALNLTARPDAAKSLAESVMPHALRATGLISRAHLAAAAQGEGAAALHATLSALDHGEADELDHSLAAIDRIGHSSGWDALAGAVAVLDAHRDIIATASSAASALDPATTTPASRSTAP